MRPVHHCHPLRRLLRLRQRRLHPNRRRQRAVILTGKTNQRIPRSRPKKETQPRICSTASGKIPAPSAARIARPLRTRAEFFAHGNRPAHENAFAVMKIAASTTARATAVATTRSRCRKLREHVDEFCIGKIIMLKTMAVALLLLAGICSPAAAQSESAATNDIRRVVTGLDKDNKAVVLFDSRLPLKPASYGIKCDEFVDHRFVSARNFRGGHR